MAIDWGFDFRATNASPWIGDPANCSPVLGELYPNTYSNGAVAGWNTGPAPRDRDSTIDARLMGENFQSNDGTQLLFRVDLLSNGIYTIALALGDAVNIIGYQYCQLRDDTAMLFTIDNATGITGNGGEWFDASGVKRTPASDWVANQVTVDKNFATTTLILLIGTPAAQSGVSAVAHLRVTGPTSVPDPLQGAFIIG